MTAVEALITPAAGTALEVDLAAIASDGNVRVDVGDITGLAASIKAEGLQQPLVIYPDGHGQWSLLAGHRRMAALESLERTTARCIVVDPPADDAARIVAQLVENMQRADLHPLEEARAFRLLVDAGLTQRAIAARTGCSQPHVSRRLKLLALGDDAAEQLLDASVPVDDIVALAALPDVHRESALESWREGRDAPWAPSLVDLVAREQNRIDRAAAHEQDLAALADAVGADLVIERIAPPTVIASEVWLANRGVTLDQLANDGTLRWAPAPAGNRMAACTDPDRYPVVEVPEVEILRAATAAVEQADGQLRDAVAAHVRATPPTDTGLLELVAEWPGRWATRRGLTIALGTEADGIDDDAAQVAALRRHVPDDRTALDVILAAFALDATLSGAGSNYRRRQALRDLADRGVDLPAPHRALLELLDAREEAEQ